MEIKIREPLCFSEIGMKDNQEDAIYPAVDKLSTENKFFILCDGMGGHESGEVASLTVSSALGSFFEQNGSGDNITKVFFDEAVNYAFDELDKKDTGATKKMGTTMTCVYLHDNGCLVAHIGDSRIYHIRPNATDIKNNRLGILYQSSDHSLVNDLLKIGELTEEEALNFPNKNIITRAMQPNLEKRSKAEVYNFTDIEGGDYFFLCCDGVLEQLTNEQLCKILSLDISDEEKLAAIKDVCDNKTKDNYTCILIPIDEVVNEEGEVENSDDNLIQGVVLEKEEVKNEEEKVLSHKALYKQYKLYIVAVVILGILLLIFFLCKNKKNTINDERENHSVKYTSII